MNIELSWDIFIVSLLILIVVYSFIIGVNKTIKTIIASYLGILCADGLGNILDQYFLASPKVVAGLKVFNLSGFTDSLINMKILIFLFVLVLITIKGPFEVNLEKFRFAILNAITHTWFTFLSSTLVISTVLVYLGGSSLIQGVASESNLAEIYTQSQNVRMMIDYYNFWFSLPVLSVILFSFFSTTEEE